MNILYWLLAEKICGHVPAPPPMLNCLLSCPVNHLSLVLEAFPELVSTSRLCKLHQHNHPSHHSQRCTIPETHDWPELCPVPLASPVKIPTPLAVASVCRAKPSSKCEAQLTNIPLEKLPLPLSCQPLRSVVSIPATKTKRFHTQCYPWDGRNHDPATQASCPLSTDDSNHTHTYTHTLIVGNVRDW